MEYLATIEEEYITRLSKENNSRNDLLRKGERRYIGGNYTNTAKNCKNIFFKFAILQKNKIIVISLH